MYAEYCKKCGGLKSGWDVGTSINICQCKELEEQSINEKLDVIIELLRQIRDKD